MRNSIAVLLDYPLQNQIDIGHFDLLKIQYENMLNLFEKVYVISPRDDQSYNLNNERIQVISDGCSGRLIKYFSLIKDFLLLRRLIKNNNIKVIRALAPSSGLVSVIAGKLTGTSTIVSLHTDRKISSKTNSENKIKNIFLNLTESWTYKHADLVPVVSKYIQKRAKELGVTKTILHYNFVDTDLFKPILHKNKIPVLIFVGRLVKVHGAHLIIKALPEILKCKKVVLKICGDGPEKKNLVRLAEELKVIKYIKFLGRVDHNKDLPKEMATSDIFVSPALSGFTLIEALASGLPLIGADIEWTKEIVTPNVGILIKSGEVKQLSSAIIKLLTDNLSTFRYNTSSASKMFCKKNWEEREREIYRTMQ